MREKMVQWLSAIEVDSNYRATRARHHPGTGAWFLTGETYLRFKQETGQHLWLHGIREWSVLDFNIRA